MLVLLLLGVILFSFKMDLLKNNETNDGNGQSNGSRKQTFIMKKLLIFLLLFPTLLNAQTGEIRWMSFTDAMEASKKEKKKILIDFYTDWCGWCKKMDASTMKDPIVAKFINDHFYAVKFNAEKESPITINDTTFAIVPNAGRNGTHGLAITLLNNRLAYPSLVFLDENFNLLSPLAGFQTKEQIEGPLRYFGENHFRQQSWADFSKTFKNSFP